MRPTDARQLSADAQYDLRRRVIHAIVHHGVKPAQAARWFGVARSTIYKWLQHVYTGGFRALALRPRGRPQESVLEGYQAATIVRLLTRRCPSQLQLPFALWTREAVQQLITQRTGLHLSVWTVGRYLKRWGFTPQKPLRRAYEQDPKEVRRWLEQEYPAIRTQARREKAVIHWGDEMGLRSQDQRGRSFGRRGQTPVIPGTGQRFGCNLISTITNRGRMAFMVFSESFTAAVLIRFLRRLVRQSPHKVFLILDRHPVHHAKAVARWVAKQANRIRIFELPTYSPELNPDEYLNQDVKSNTLGQQRPHDKMDMIADLRTYLRSTQKRPDIVKNYFKHPSVTYTNH